MFTRITGLFIVPIWFAAMGWLVMHDVWPRLAAHDPPPLTITDWLKTDGKQSQYDILDINGHSIGTIWSTFMIDEGVSATRDDFVYIEKLPLPVAPLAVSVTSVFTATGLLDEFTVGFSNFAGTVTLHGERFHSSFSFTLDGTVTGRNIQTRFKLPLTEAGLLTNAFQPFSQLANLSVGQTWRMQTYNPIAAVTGMGERFLDMLVTVTNREKRTTESGPRDCYVIESKYAKAWIDDHGIVHEQEIALPVVGKLRIVRQTTYHEQARIDAKKSSSQLRTMPP